MNHIKWTKAYFENRANNKFQTFKSKFSLSKIQTCENSTSTFSMFYVDLFNSYLSVLNFTKNYSFNVI